MPVKPTKQPSTKRAKPRAQPARRTGTVQNRTYQAQLAASRPQDVKIPKNNSLPMYVQCVINPEDSPPCRLPDDYTSPTSVIKLIEEYTISSDATGTCVFGVYPGVAYSRVSYTVTSGSTGVAVTTPHPDFTSLAGQFINGRINCMAITVNYIAPLMTASGRLVAITDQDTNAISDNILVTSVLDDGESTPAQNGKRVVVRARQPPRFEGVVSSYGAPTMPYTYFVGVGLQPGVVVFSVRVVRHFEGVPSKSSVIRGTARPGFSLPHALTIVANMGAIGTISTSDAGSKKGAIEEATSAAHAAWNLLGSTVMKYGPSVSDLAESLLTGLMI